MATIELVIRIPEEEYQNILHTGEVSFCTVNAIEAGTPLPKGHGRLIDADQMLHKMNKTDVQPITHAECYAFDFAKTLFKKAPIIIEASKAEGEDKE